MTEWVSPLPHPFLEDRHRVLAERLRGEWGPGLQNAQAKFDAGEFDEDSAARAFVAVLSREGLLEQVLKGGVRDLCVAREFAAGVSGFADNQLALQGLGSYPIALAGTESLKDRFLSPAERGEQLPAFALTEPEAGSDAGAVETTAAKDGDHYVLEGTKTLISNAGLASYYCVFARLAGSKDTVALVVEGQAKGLAVERLSVLAPHPIGTVKFQGCRVPSSQRLGDEGEGISLAFRTLEKFRPSVGAAALGLAQRGLTESREHVRRRQQFGRPLAKFQMLRQKLADMLVAAELAQLAVYRAAWLLDGNQANRSERAQASSLAKLTATEFAQQVVDETVQLFGGRGVLQGEIAERLYREVRALRIYEGTSEVQRLILAKELLDSDSNAE